MKTENDKEWETLINKIKEAEKKEREEWDSLISKINKTIVE